MKRSKPFLNLMLADFIARSGYQMGKTPLLPIFANALGASGAFLGAIVSVSTITGLVLKPFFGILSDRGGRRAWLLIGACFFAFMPFTYGFISNTEQLLVVRLVHGLATAIYGPVTLAYIAELSRRERGRVGSLGRVDTDRRHRPGDTDADTAVAEDIGWFQMARSGGYIVGPALAGGLLTVMDPAAVFTVIGLISCAVFLPVLALPDTRPEKKQKRKPLLQHIRNAIRDGGRMPAIWLTGSLEAITFIALYTLKAFLPIYALDAGVSAALVGSFFSLQEAAHVIAKPYCGRLGDRYGYLPVISLGMLVLSASLPLVDALDAGAAFLAPALMMGLAQALIFPAAIALVSHRISPEHLGAGMGLIGMMQNFGKVAGPILGGLAIQALGYEATLLCLSAALALGALVIWVVYLPRRRIATEP
ncbi:MAG: MFS transporter [Chloroflexota bacterium]|nr:MFS transporter [Chloroflexota bacterium]